MDREAWRAAVHGAAKSWTRLSDWTELNRTIHFLPFIHNPRILLKKNNNGSVVSSVSNSAWMVFITGHWSVTSPKNFQIPAACEEGLSFVLNPVCLVLWPAVVEEQIPACLFKEAVTESSHYMQKCLDFHPSTVSLLCMPLFSTVVGFPDSSVGKESNAMDPIQSNPPARQWIRSDPIQSNPILLQCRRPQFDSWIGKII